MTEIRASEILDAIGPAAVGGPDVGSFVTHTGGSIATVFMGEPDDEGHYLIAIGPGHYHWHRPADSEFDFIELYVGPDAQDDRGDYVTSLPELVAAVRRWLPIARADRNGVKP